jgi:hypothetical protein
VSGLSGLIRCAGHWAGTNTMHDPGTGKPESTATSSVVVPILGGRFARIDYDWSYQGKPQEGSWLIGFEKPAGPASAHWIDTWYMSERIMVCRGSAEANGTIHVLGSSNKMLESSRSGDKTGDVSPRVSEVVCQRVLRIRYPFLPSSYNRSANGIPERTASGVCIRLTYQNPRGGTAGSARPTEQEPGPRVGRSFCLSAPASCRPKMETHPHLC